MANPDEQLQPVENKSADEAGQTGQVAAANPDPGSQAGDNEQTIENEQTNAPGLSIAEEETFDEAGEGQGAEESADRGDDKSNEVASIDDNSLSELESKKTEEVNKTTDQEPGQEVIREQDMNADGLTADSLVAKSNSPPEPENAPTSVNIPAKTEALIKEVPQVLTAQDKENLYQDKLLEKLNIARVKKQTRYEERLQKVIDVFKQKQDLAVNQDIELGLRVSDATATRYLQTLVKRGLVTRLGKGVNTKYKLTQAL